MTNYKRLNDLLKEVYDLYADHIDEEIEMSMSKKEYEDFKKLISTIKSFELLW